MAVAAIRDADFFIIATKPGGSLERLDLFEKRIAVVCTATRVLTLTTVRSEWFSDPDEVTEKVLRASFHNSSLHFS